MSENSELFKKSKPGAQFQCEWISSVDQPSRFTRGSEVKPILEPDTAPFKRGCPYSVAPGRRSIHKRQRIKGMMYTAHTSTLPSKYEAWYPPGHLPWLVPPTNFAPVGGRAWTTPWGCGWVRHSSWKDLAGEFQPLHEPSRKPSLLSKLILAPAICSYLATAFFTAFMSRRRHTKPMLLPKEGQQKGYRAGPDLPPRP